MDNTTNDLENAIFNRLQELKTDTDLEFIKEFLESAPKQMEEDFVNLSAAVRGQNAKERMFHAHKLKGLLLTIGADEAAARCLKLETIPGDAAESDVKTIFATLETEIEYVRQALYRVGPKILHA